MDSYTITIAPNDDSGNSTTLVVNTSGDQIRITDVHLHAAGGLSGGTMPTVDFGLLLRAVGSTPAGQQPIEATRTDPPAVAETATTPSADDADLTAGGLESRPTRAPRPRRAKRTPPVAEPRRSRRGAATAAAGQDADSGRRRRRTSATPAKATRTKAAPATATTQTAGSGRAYRRMPEDFRAMYQQTPSPAALADHYGVPRHTAQGWIRRVKAGN
jgi:hypothetical protein